MDDSWRGGQFGKMFESFANVLIEQMLPRIREQIAARFPGATLRAIEIEGKRIHLLDARIPIGARLVVEATRATLITRAEDLVSGGLGALSLERMEGTISIGTVRARASFEGDPPSSDWVRGTLSLSDLQAAGETFTGRARVLVSSDAWSIVDGVIEREGARLTLALRGRTSGLTSARSSASAFPSAAIAEVLTELGATFVPPIARAIRGRVSGTVAVEPDRDRVDARVDLRTDASYLAIEVDGAMRAIRRASARGKIAWQDVLSPELFAHVRGASPISVNLEGTAIHDVQGTIRCPQLDLRWMRTPLALEVSLAGGHAELAITGTGVSLRAEAIARSDGALSGGGSSTIEPSVLIASAFVPGLDLDGSPVALGAIFRGTTRAPGLDVTASSDRVTLKRGETKIAVSRVRASAKGSRLDASARVGRGTIAFVRDGRDRVRIDRADAAMILAFVAPNVTWPIEGGELWARLERVGTAWIGEAHLEGDRSRVTAKPLRFDVRERALDGTKLDAIVGARDLARWVGPFGPVGGAIHVDLALERAPIARLFEIRARGLAHGDLEIGLADRSFPVREIHVPIAIDGSLHVERARARLFGGSVALSGALEPRGGRLDVLTIDGVGEGLSRFLLGRDALPGLRIDGWLGRESQALAGPLSIRTDRSTLSISTKIDEKGSLEGTALQGTIDTGDLSPFIGSFLDGAVHRLEGKLGGTLREPIAKIDARGSKQRIRGVGVELDLEDPRVSLHLSRARMAWSDLYARVNGGEIRSSGALLRTELGSLFGARASVDGVALDEIVLDRGTVGSLLGGTAHASFDVWRGGETSIVRGTVRIDTPRYAFLERARRTVKRLSLDLPGIEGLEPFRAEARLSAGRWTLSNIKARVAKLAVDGRVELGALGAIDGRLALAPEADWLRASPYLSPFADLLARAGLPLLLGGEIGGLRVRPDLAALGDDIVTRSPIGRRLREVLERAFPDAFERPSRPGERETHRATSLMSTDALFDRLAAGGDDASEAFETLIDRGLAPDEIAARIAGR